MFGPIGVPPSESESLPTLDLLPPPAKASRPRPQPRHSAIAEPWLRSWLYRAKGESSTLGWVIGIHVLGLAGLIALPLMGISLWPGWPALSVAVGLAMLGGIGTTVGYHRALTHRAVVLNPVVEHLLTFFAMLNGSGTPLTWVSNHRLHHATSDSEEDISSPAQGGFMWAHLRWIWQAGQAPADRYCPDLDRPVYRFWSRMQIPMLALSLFGGLFFGLAAWLWVGPLRLLWSLHAQCTINSICHLDDPKAIGGSSKNVWWLSAFHFLQGENWHRNHHEEPTDARLGQTAAQVDLGWWAIVAMKWCGLAKKIRRPRAVASSVVES